MLSMCWVQVSLLVVLLNRWLQQNICLCLGHRNRQAHVLAFLVALAMSPIGNELVIQCWRRKGIPVKMSGGCHAELWETSRQLRLAKMQSYPGCQHLANAVKLFSLGGNMFRPAGIFLVQLNDSLFTFALSSMT